MSDPIKHACGCVEMDGKWSSICEEHYDFNLRLEEDAKKLAAQADEIERLRALVEAAWEEGRQDGYRDGLTDGHPLGSVTEYARFEDSKAKAKAALGGGCES